MQGIREYAKLQYLALQFQKCHRLRYVERKIQNRTVKYSYHHSAKACLFGTQPAASEIALRLVLRAKAWEDWDEFKALRWVS